MFTSEIIEHIVYQNNLYAKQRDINTSFIINSNEIMNFIGILIYMGIVSMPSTDDYWSKWTKAIQVSQVLSGKRFKLLCRMIHFNNNENMTNTTDKVFKIRPLYNMITKIYF